MPRPGPPRPVVGVRLSANGIAYLDHLAADATERAGKPVTRSDIIRRLLTLATTDTHLARRATAPDKATP